MNTYEMTVRFDKGYIGHPYWPEMARVIDIQKQSGMNRAKSAATRRKALEEYLLANAMTLADYERLEILSKRPFYTDDDGQIIIPEAHVMAFLVNTCSEARSATRPCEPDQVRSRFLITPWATGKTKSDGVYERFATVSSGTGQKLSNQRGFRSNEYIGPFKAVGRISFEEEYVKPDVAQNAIVYGGRFVGIGASRKMGWGRFEVESFEPVE